MDTIELLGVRIHAVTVEQVLAYIEQTVRDDRRAVIVYVNAHALNLAYEQPWFRDFLNRSDIVFCDGFGVKWAARLTGRPLPERFTPPDWIGKLATRAARNAQTFFLLGARPGVAERAAARLQAQCSELQIAGTQHGYFDHTSTSAENQAVLNLINAARPTFLILGMGMPLQERWLMENWDQVNARVAVTTGALLDYVAGEVWRGPRWMTDHGLEWLARLFVEPRRLWRRYLIGNPLFLWRVLKEQVRRH